MTGSYESQEHISLRQRAFTTFMKYGNLKPKDICKLLQLNYDIHGRYIRNLKAQWKRNYIFGLGSRVHGKPESFHKAHGWVYVDSLNLDARTRAGLSRERAVGSGWVESRNRNRALIWRDSLGRMEWHHKSGRVNLFVRQPPPATKGRVYQLFCNGFSMTGLVSDMAVLDVVLKSIRLKGASAVWDLGVKVPYFVIDLFKMSNGVVIKGGDLSHPTGIEVEFCLPDFQEKAEAQLARNTQIIEEFMKLLRGQEPSSQKPNHFPDFYSK